MNRSIDDVIHFMKQVQNPEWMTDLVTELKHNNSNAINYIDGMLRGLPPIGYSEIKTDLENLKAILTR